MARSMNRSMNKFTRLKAGRREAAIPQGPRHGINPLAMGEVGKVGVAIDSIEDMQCLFDGIDLTKISTSMTINATASILLALYVAVAKRQGAETRKLSGTVQNDVLKEYIARGTYIYPPQQAMRIITDLFAWTNENVPDWNTISISGYHMREAGSTAVQEVAFTLGNGIAYVQAAINAGLDVDKFAPRLSFFFNAHNNFLEEVAKFRAARRVWAKIMKTRFGARNQDSMRLRFHCQTAAATLTKAQPLNNVIRTALQALSAALPIALTADSFISRCGFSSLLLDRVKEWLSELPAPQRLVVLAQLQGALDPQADPAAKAVDVSVRVIGTSEASSVAGDGPAHEANASASSATWRRFI